MMWFCHAYSAYVVVDTNTAAYVRCKTHGCRKLKSYIKIDYIHFFKFHCKVKEILKLF